MTKKGKRQVGLENVASLWPTPKSSAENYGQPRENDRGDLQAATSLWGSPTATAWKGGTRTGPTDSRLPAQAERDFWQTPRCAQASFYAERDETLAARGRDGRDTLPRQAEAAVEQLWATPRASLPGGKDLSNPKNGKVLEQQFRSFHQVPPTETDGGDTSKPSLALNPRFVSALMGLPHDWADAEAQVESISFERWEMRSSHSVRRLLSSS